MGMPTRGTYSGAEAPIGVRRCLVSPDLVRSSELTARRRRSQQAASAAIEASSYPERTRFLPWLDEQLEELYTQRTGMLTRKSIADGRREHFASAA